MFRAGLGRWVSVAKLGPDEPVTCVHWACTMGRSAELVAVGAGSHVTVFSLRGAADDPKVPRSFPARMVLDVTEAGQCRRILLVELLFMHATLTSPGCMLAAGCSRSCHVTEFSRALLASVPWTGPRMCLLTKCMRESAHHSLAFRAGSPACRWTRWRSWSLARPCGV